MAWLRVILLAVLSSASPNAVHSLQKHCHDNSFQPDIVLSVTRQNVSIGGMPMQRTMVNDSIPGPEIRLPEGQTTWIRVYNNIADANLTMVCPLAHAEFTLYFPPSFVIRCELQF